jgi:hypothetical protein
LTKDEALKLALETLEWAVEQAGGPLCEHESGGACCFCKENNAITAIKEALAQPMQEPVAHCYVQKGTSVDILTFDDAPDDAVAGTIFHLYAAPPKREWVGLTEQDMPGGEDPMFDHQYFIAGMVYASTFLKEKNT